VVTTYYNPAGYKRRLQNYRAFRKNLQAPLLAVELAKADAHELSDGDADILVSLTGEDRIWQKERLIAIGVSRLPKHVRHIAWVDCDLVFDDPAWPAAAMAQVDETGGLVQVFGTVAHLPADIDPRVAAVDDCRRARPLFSGAAIADVMRNGLYEENQRKLANAQAALAEGRYYEVLEGYTIYGMGWAARREIMEACGFFDKAVVGGADAIQIIAAYGKLDDYFNARGASTAFREAAFAWAEKARQAGLFRSVSALESRAYHLWHGEMPDRRYQMRQGILIRHDYDPARDLRLADNGTWMWADPDGPLAADVEAYFFSRHEDGRA
jgi:hypothetical protein